MPLTPRRKNSKVSSSSFSATSTIMREEGSLRMISETASAGFDEVGRHWDGAACDWSNADEHERALAALKRSKDDGFANAHMVNLEPSFATLQDDPELARLFGP